MHFLEIKKSQVYHMIYLRRIDKSAVPLKLTSLKVLFSYTDIYATGITVVVSVSPY